MKRKSTIRVDFPDGSFSIATVLTKGNELTRDESQSQHDTMVDDVVAAVRCMQYAGTAPLRNVSIR